MSFRYRVCWTNWTFGIWWGKLSKSPRATFNIGIDLGPLELHWSEK